MQFVTESMGIIYFPVRFESSVASSDGDALPFPALIEAALINLAPKQKLYGASIGMPRDKPLRRTFFRTAIIIVSRFRGRGVIATPALTFAVRLKEAMLCYPRGIALEIFGKVGRGIRIGLHQNQLSGVKPGATTNRRLVFLFDLPLHYITFERVGRLSNG